MRFDVPQFVDIEDKIFGPLTIKQFVYVAGGIGGVVVGYILLPSFLFFIFAPLIAGLSVSLAFVPVNKRPMSMVLESAFTYISKSRLYLWKKTQKKVIGTGNSTSETGLYTPPKSTGNLVSLSRNLEITSLNSSEREVREDLKKITS